MPVVSHHQLLHGTMQGLISTLAWNVGEYGPFHKHQRLHFAVITLRAHSHLALVFASKMCTTVYFLQW